MVTVNSSFWRDNNRVPITTDGIMITNSKTFTTTGTNAVPIFHVTGSVEIRGLWGVVTTTLGNHTAAAWRLNDQTAQVDITAVGGTSLTGIAAGSTISKKGLAAAALTKLDNVAGVVSEPTTLETTYFSPFVAVKKTAATTDIEYVYTTSDNPTTGVIEFFIRFIPLSADGTLTAV